MGLCEQEGHEGKGLSFSWQKASIPRSRGTGRDYGMLENSKNKNFK